MYEPHSLTSKTLRNTKYEILKFASQQQSFMPLNHCKCCSGTRGKGK